MAMADTTPDVPSYPQRKSGGLAKIRSLLRTFLAPVKRKDLGHWVRVALLIALGVYLGHQLGERPGWILLRYKIYKYQQLISDRQTWAKRTSLVYIGDDEYWAGGLARRVPLKRDYIARLLRKVASADPAVIAIDFDLRSPKLDGSLFDHPEYRRETEQLVQAIRDVSRASKIVLPKNINFNPKGEGYITEPSIYDPYNLPTDRVFRGYIELPYDLRQVPLPLPLPDGSTIDSLASAVVRAAGEREALKLAISGNDALPYGRFLEPKSFPHYSAREVFQADPDRLRDILAHRIVILGANWSRFSYGRGGGVDDTFSPVGTVGGAFIHANYIEALINSDDRILKPLGENTAITLEALLSFAIAYIFAVKIRRRRKALLATGACVAVILLSYIFWQNLGLFFDFFIPMILLIAHAGYEQVMTWREASLREQSLVA